MQSLKSVVCFMLASQFGLVTFQVLNSHVWLVAPLLDSTLLENRIYSVSYGVTALSDGASLSAPSTLLFHPHHILSPGTLQISLGFLHHSVFAHTTPSWLWCPLHPSHLHIPPLQLVEHAFHPSLDWSSAHFTKPFLLYPVHTSMLILRTYLCIYLFIY